MRTSEKFTVAPYEVQFAKSHVALNGKSFKLVVIYPLAPTVTSQPSSATVTEGQTATFKAAASGSPVPTVQWEESSDGGTTWTAVAGATSDELVVPATTLGESGTEYRAAFKNEAQNASVKSSAATLTVNE